MITKAAISVTLHRDNLTWLKGKATAAGHRSVSELLDRLVTAARTSGQVAPARSVVGTIEIDSSDALLEGADAAVRRLFEASLNRPAAGLDAATSRRHQKRVKTRRG